MSDQEDESGVGKTKGKRKPAEHLRLKTVRGMTYALKNIGTWWDEDTPSFGLRSSKRKASWIYRLRIDGKETSGTLQYAKEGNGITTFNYEQAIAEYSLRRDDASIPLIERERRASEKVKSDRRKVTLEGGLEQYLSNRLTRGAQDPLADDTKATYRRKFDEYLKNTVVRGRVVGKLVLLETTAGEWREILQAIAISNINK